MKYAKIGVIVAMTKEFELVKSLLSDVCEQENTGFRFCIGNVGTKQIVLLKSGIGKVNAAAATLSLIVQHRPDCIINTGVAGGIDRSLSVADVVVGEYTCYHDFYAGEVSDHQKELGFPDLIPADANLLAIMRSLSANQVNVKIGLVCTGDQFITDNASLMVIKDKRPVGLAVDMESNSIAHVCFLSNIPFLSFRIISDTPWVHNQAEQYQNFWEEAPLRTFSLFHQLLDLL